MGSCGIAKLHLETSIMHKSTSYKILFVCSDAKVEQGGWMNGMHGLAGSNWCLEELVKNIIFTPAAQRLIINIMKRKIQGFA